MHTHSAVRVRLACVRACIVHALGCSTLSSLSPSNVTWLSVWSALNFGEEQNTGESGEAKRVTSEKGLCGVAGLRSPYPSHAKRVLYQLSYNPMMSNAGILTYLPCQVLFRPGHCNAILMNVTPVVAKSGPTYPGRCVCALCCSLLRPVCVLHCLPCPVLAGLACVRTLTCVRVCVNAGFAGALH